MSKDFLADFSLGFHRIFQLEQAFHFLLTCMSKGDTVGVNQMMESSDGLNLLEATCTVKAHCQGLGCWISHACCPVLSAP